MSLRLAVCIRCGKERPLNPRMLCRSCEAIGYAEVLKTCGQCGQSKPRVYRGLCRECAKQNRKVQDGYEHNHRRSKRNSRECLGCGKIFRSAGNWNRLCEDCREANGLVSPLAIYGGYDAEA